jgi:hypothetical protein
MRAVACCAVLFSACAPVVQINGAVALNDECIATPENASLQEGLLDIGFDASTTNEYTAALIIGTDAKDVTFDTVEVYFSTDVDREGDLALQGPPAFNTPVNPQTARVTAIGATSANNVVLAPVITREDAAELQGQPFVANQLDGNPNGRSRIIANITVTGKTSGGADVRTNALPLPIELCRGCLVPVCDAGQTIAASGCRLGQDNGVGVCQ